MSDDFDYMDLNATSEQDLREALEVGGVLSAIISEKAGGIVAYAYHAQAIELVRLLNANNPLLDYIDSIQRVHDDAHRTP